MMIADLDDGLSNSEVCQYLDQNSQSLIYLKLLRGILDPRKLYELLKKFPLLKTLELYLVYLTMETSIDFTNEVLKKLLNFKASKMEMNFDSEKTF